MTTARKGNPPVFLLLQLHAQGEANVGGDFKKTVPANDFSHPSHGHWSRCASPPCLADGLDPAALGYLSTPDVIALLNLLLEGKRAGARGLAQVCSAETGEPRDMILRDIATDEGRFCAMLTRHIIRLGGTPSPHTGTFYRKHPFRS